jgi:hypothetical protein
MSHGMPAQMECAQCRAIECGECSGILPTALSSRTVALTDCTPVPLHCGQVSPSTRRVCCSCSQSCEVFAMYYCCDSSGEESQRGQQQELLQQHQKEQQRQQQQLQQAR